MFLSEQYQRLSAEIQNTATKQAAKRQTMGLSTEIRLLLVSKYQSKTDVYQALDYFTQNKLPCPSLAESYVQEAEKRAFEIQKYDVPKLELIGHLQSNKAERAVELFSTIHSVSSLKLVKALLKARKKLQKKDQAKKLCIFLQYNASGEEQKSGCRNYDELRELLESILPHSEHFCVRGLMCMAAAGSTSTERHSVFGDCREQALRLWAEFQSKTLLPYPELSMGMSQDYREALAEGASVLRIGSLLFSS